LFALIICLTGMRAMRCGRRTLFIIAHFSFSKSND
jgi:hypothetical protein